MKEVAFGYLPDESFDALEDLEEVFLTSGYVSPSVVDKTLERVATACDNKLQADSPIIVGLGDPSELWYRANPAPKDMDPWDCYARRPPAGELEEIEAAFSGIRRHVAEGLRTAFPDTTFILAGGLEGRIAFADGGVVKLPIDYNPNVFGDSGEPPGSKRQRMEALRTLYALPERSKFIAYNILSIDPTEKTHQGTQVQRKLPIVTLDTLLDSVNPPCLQEVVRYLKETAEGLGFLVQNGLRLTDVTLRNIAIHSNTNQALLFDFDGLRLDDAIMEAYMAAPEWWPPERRPRIREENDGVNQFMRMPLTEIDVAKPRGPVEVSEMVFELGTSLSLAFERYADIPAEIARLAAGMTEANPENRPSLKEVIAILRDAFQDSTEKDTQFGVLAI